MSTIKNFDQSFGCLRHRTAPQLLKRKTPSSISILVESQELQSIQPLSILPTSYTPIKHTIKRISLARRCEAQPFATDSSVRCKTQTASTNKTATINISDCNDDISAKKKNIIEPKMQESTVTATDQFVLPPLTNDIKKKSKKKHKKNEVDSRESAIAEAAVMIQPSSCVCRRHNGDDWIGCNGNGCPDEWFHMKCVGLRAKDLKRLERWYCFRCRIKNGQFKRNSDFLPVDNFNINLV